MKQWGVLAGVVVAMAASVSAQQTVETDPLQCWWRTSAAAVRVGRPFSVVLTCAVVETDTIVVAPDQAPLDPTVMQIPPFELLGGTHQADLRTNDRRFFQYEYRLRLIGEDAFGKDVELPETKISYRVQSRVGDGPPIEGREQTYFLPPMSVRVASLVPGDATDIRDASATTFGDVAARAFRADVLRVTALALFALAGLAVVLAAVRLVGRYRAANAAQTQLVPDVAILRQIGRELAVVGRDRHATGWTPALAQRLTTALRLVAAYALSRRVVQIPLSRQSESSASQLPDYQTTQLPNAAVVAGEGRLEVRRGWIGAKSVAVSGSVTPDIIRHALGLAPASAPAAATRRARLLKDLERVLRRLTETQYGRDSRFDEQALAGLDDALEVGVRAVRQVTASHTWLRKKLASAPRVWQHVWSR